MNEDVRKLLARGILPVKIQGRGIVRRKDGSVKADPPNSVTTITVRTKPATKE